MLPRPARLSRRTDFTEVVRRGRRASRPLLTVHLLLPEPSPAPSGDLPVARAGLVVPRAVGGAVERHRTARRLRHLLRPRLLGADAAVPPGARLVVRAAAGAAAATSAQLGEDLDAALASALAPRRERGPRPSATAGGGT